MSKSQMQQMVSDKNQKIKADNDEDDEDENDDEGNETVRLFQCFALQKLILIIRMITVSQKQKHRKHAFTVSYKKSMGTSIITALPSSMRKMVCLFICLILLPMSGSELWYVCIYMCV